MMKLSIIILTANEESNLARCLNSLPAGAETIIVDSGSTDRTLEIAQNFGARTVVREMDNFGAQRNFGLDQAANDWVFFLDADEEISGELRGKIDGFIGNKENIIGYDIRRYNYMIGKRLNHCWNPDYVLRLFNKKFARYEGEIHEHAVPNGTVVRIEDPILHYTFQSVAQYFAKVNHYTTVVAERQYKEKVSPKGMVSRAWGMFTQTLLGKKGILDGKRGVILAFMEGIQSFLTSAKLWELYEKNK